MPGHGFYLSIPLADAEILVQLECPFFFHPVKAFSIEFCTTGRFIMGSEPGWHTALCCSSPHSCCRSASCSGAVSFKVAWAESQKMKTCFKYVLGKCVCLKKPHKQKLLRDWIWFLKFSDVYLNFPQIRQTACSFLPDFAKRHRVAFYQQLPLMHLKMPLFCLYSLMALHSLDLNICKKHQEQFFLPGSWCFFFQNEQEVL